MLVLPHRLPSSSNDVGAAPVCAVVVSLLPRDDRTTIARRRSLGARHDVRTIDVEIASDGSWFRVRGATLVDCSRRPVLRRLLVALATSPRGRPCSIVSLVEAGWPGEKMSPAAARNRLHVSLNRLRTLGLDVALITEDGGYLLDPRLTVRCAP
jgi:hypothetical protein